MDVTTHDGDAVWKQVVTLPADLGGTRCSVQVRPASKARPPVAVITDYHGNEGVSAHLVVSALTSSVRSRLPEDLEEPMWVLCWPERAVASVLVGSADFPTYHLLVRDPEGWRQVPLPASVADWLVGDSSSSGTAG